jgi:hypothetical protein
MKIADSSVTMNSESFRAEKFSVKENFRFWISNDEQNAPKSNISRKPDASNSISQKSDKIDIDKKLLDEPAFGWKFQLIIDLFETFFDKEVDLSFLEDILTFDEDVNNRTQELNKMWSEPLVDSANENTGFGWGMEYDREEIKYEKQMLNFSAEGQVKTADGRSIGFSFNLDISSEILEKNNLSIRAGDAQRQDPIIINFSGNSALLSSKRFMFDINSDGVEEGMSLLNNGSGFLAFDKNRDNIINDGSELFGTKSGNGFADLRKYDDDKNGWIDENDDIYESLSVWEKTNDKDKLNSIKSKNIGAIFLNSSRGDFELKSSFDDKFGEIRKTGIYLNESGKPGSIHQLDLFV